MYYGFNESTGQCIWSIDVQPQPQAGVVIMHSEVEHDIVQIKLEGKVDNYSIAPVVPSEEDIINAAKRERDSDMEKARLKIDTLNDVMEFEPSEQAEAELIAWRKYRAALYNMSFDPIVWPTSPDDVKK